MLTGAPRSELMESPYSLKLGPYRVSATAFAAGTSKCCRNMVVWLTMYAARSLVRQLDSSGFGYVGMARAPTASDKSVMNFMVNSFANLGKDTGRIWKETWEDNIFYDVKPPLFSVGLCMSVLLGKPLAISYLACTPIIIMWKENCIERASDVS